MSLDGDLPTPSDPASSSRQFVLRNRLKWSDFFQRRHRSPALGNSSQESEEFTFEEKSEQEARSVENSLRQFWEDTKRHLQRQRRDPPKRDENPDETGWDRIRAIYNFDKYNMERHITAKSILYTSGTIFAICGVFGAPEALRRFEAYAVGKNFVSPRNALRRKLDYAFVAFLRNGYKPAFLVSVLMAAFIGGVTHLTEYRNKFSWTYFPAVSGACCAFSYRACGILAIPLRVRGMASAVSIGLSAGLLMSGITWVAALEQGVSFDDMYWIFKEELEQDLQTSWDKEQKIKEITAKENVWRSQARKILEENEKRNALFAKEYAEEGADAHPESD